MEASISAIASVDEDARAAGVKASSASVLPWLASREQNWLMIFDGVDSGYAEVEAFIPAGKRGNILISSRNYDMQRLASPSNAFMEVIELDQGAAVALFTESARLNEPDPSHIAHIEAIVRELCYLPLAVDQAAASIASGLCHVDEYLETFKRHRLRLMDNLTFKGSSNYGRAVYTTWDMSFAELERRANARTSDSTTYEAAILLLRILSFFHFDGIREDTFRRAARTQDEWLPSLPQNSQLFLLLQRNEENDWDFFSFRQAVHVLSMFSLVRSTGRGTHSIHRLVHQWMQDRLPKSYCSVTGLFAANILVRSEDYGKNSDDCAHRRALLIHIRHLITRLKQNGLMHQLSIDALQRMAYVYCNGGKPADAEALLRQAVSLVEKDNSEATEQYISIMADLATVLYSAKKWREAEDIGRYVLEWREKHLGTDDLSISYARRDLSVILYQLGQHKAAKEMQAEVVDWQKEHLGMNHPDIYFTISYLAATLYHLGELSEARRLEEQVLKWRKEQLGIDHPDTHWIMDSLSITLCALRELAEARALQVQVLGWRKVHLGMDHPDTYRTMAGLAITLVELGELAEGRGLQVQVLEWRKAHLGVDHPDTYRTMASLANTFAKLGELAKARRLQMQVLEGRKVHLGMDHPDTYWAMVSLADTLVELGVLAEARGLQVQMFEWRKAYPWMDHVDSTYLAIGHILR
jgi:tetratricopeptide (TPR) repeat protein